MILWRVTDRTTTDKFEFFEKLYGGELTSCECDIPRAITMLFSNGSYTSRAQVTPFPDLRPIHTFPDTLGGLVFGLSELLLSLLFASSFKTLGIRFSLGQGRVQYLESLDISLRVP